MAAVLVYAGDTPTVAALQEALESEKFEVQRVASGDQLVHRFIYEGAVAVICDFATPWTTLMPLLRRIRAHGSGKRYRLLLFGDRPLQATDAACQTLGILNSDIFTTPIDTGRLLAILKMVPTETIELKEEKAQSIPRSPLGFAIHGRFEDLVLPRLMCLVQTQRGSGRFELELEGTRMSLTFKEGDIIGSDAFGGPASFLELLGGQNRLSDEQKLMVSNDSFIGLEKLLELEMIGPHEIPKLLKDQAECVIRIAVGRASGNYRWDDAAPTQGLFSLGMNLYRHLIDGFKQRFPLQLPPEIAGLKPALDSLQRETLRGWGLVPFELRCVNQLNGSRTIREVLELVTSGNEDRERDGMALFLSFKVAGLLGTPPALDEEETDWDGRRSQLDEEFKRMNSADPFQILGITPKSTIAEVRTQFVSLSKIYHPDRAFKAPDDIRNRMEDIFRRIQGAYEIAGDPKRREEFFANKDQDGVGIDVKLVIRAEIAFSQGELFLKNRNFVKAMEFFKDAVSLNPISIEYKAYLGWAMFCDDQTQFAAAAKLILEAIKVNPNMDRGYYFMGCIFKVRNDMEQAENAFRKAASVNPNNIEALRELRLIEMRRESGPKGAAKKGIFDRFKKS